MLVQFKNGALARCLGMLCFACAFSTRAEFTLNFQPITTSGFPGPCNVSYAANSFWCATAGAAEEIDPDPTPYVQETVSIDSVSYWHQIIGDPADGFAMEVYIVHTRALNSDSGGRPATFPSFAFNNNLDVQSGNGWDPLGLDPSRDHEFTGNGTGNPTTVIMRQVLGGTWDADTQTWSCGTAAFCLDFVKDQFDRKPLIIQTVNDSGMSAHFEMDMRNSTYADSTTAGALINTVSFDTGIGDFDLSSDAQDSNVSGGRYIFAPGAGWVDDGTASQMATWNYDEGAYAYEDGGFNHLEIDAGSYWDAAQNPWGGPGNEAKCDSGALTGSCP